MKNQKYIISQYHGRIGVNRCRDEPAYSYLIRSKISGDAQINIITHNRKEATRFTWKEIKDGIAVGGKGWKIVKA